MTTPANPVAVTPAPLPTLEQRLELAAQQAAQVAALINPTIGEAIQAGTQVEPVISGFIRLMIALFHHHASQPVAPAAPAPAPAVV